ncbi:hypothetical protein [uncultured Pseudokineococcus sp.]|uniref:hypothetical protein n=1 Tax=uncultured Pseudokineococcus sp. TaxID=1642928 RepID=UPI00260869CD|nr:hypothetical protein [uncultured Pseudokineococcus sp.]
MSGAGPEVGRGAPPADDVDVLRVLAPDEDAAVVAEELSLVAETGSRGAVLASSPGLPEEVLALVRRGVTRVLRPGEPVRAGAVVVGTPRPEHDLLAAVESPVVLGRAELPAGAAALLRALDGRLPGGRGNGPEGPDPVGPGPVAAGSSGRRRVLLVSSNGSGLGHLTRLVAMGRRASAGTDVHVLSMSSAVPLAAEGLLPYEYVPSAGDLGISARRWNVLLHRRLGEAVRRFRPDVLVFDGTYPYRAVAELGDRFPGVRLVWSRRPMWKPRMGAVQLGLVPRFDLVLEPGELAADLDRGLTVGRGDALPVRPITLLDQHELVGAAQARTALGLEQDVPTALVTLGAGAWHDVDSQLGAVVAGLRRVTPDAQICLVRPSIARSGADPGHGVRTVSAYPLSRYLRAFDVVVTAAGYNTFHEAVAFGRASGFVGVTAQLDDQPQRARWAQREGVGVDLDPLDPSSVARVAELLVDERARERCTARCAQVWPGNGAAEAMAAVEAVADGASGRELLGRAGASEGRGGREREASR